MSAQRWIRRIVVSAIIGVASVSVAATSSSVDRADAQTPVLGAGGEFHPLVPYRAFDSRPESAINVTAPGARRIDPAAEFNVRLAGTGTLPASSADVLAVIATVTVVDPTASGWLAVRPSGTSGTSSLVNFAPGRNVPNLAIVGLGADGAITVTMGPSSAGSANVIIDVFGFLSKSSYSGTRGARLVPVGPARLTDTRETGRPLGAAEVRPVQIRGANSYMPTITPAVPNRSSVSAALVSIAAVNNRAGSTSTYLSASPTPPTPPIKTSNVNVVRGQIKTSMAVVPVVDGNIYVYNHAGETDMIVDVFGYFETRADDSTSGRIVPLDAPFRALDTRDPAFGSFPLGTGTVEDWSFDAFTESVSLPSGSGIDLSAQSALIGNLTATDLTRLYPSVGAATYLTGYPGDVARPLVANLNIVEGEVVPNMSLIPYSTAGAPNQIKVYNHYGSMHYVLDVYAIVLK
jgi:hypothetical protein